MLCTDIVHPFVPKLTCTESDVTRFNPVRYIARLKTILFVVLKKMQAGYTRSFVLIEAICKWL